MWIRPHIRGRDLICNSSYTIQPITTHFCKRSLTVTGAYSSAIHLEFVLMSLA